MTTTVQEFSRDIEEMIRRVEAGDEVVVTRDGIPIVRLEHVSDSRFDAEGFSAALSNIRRGAPIGLEGIRAMIDEGRR